MLPSFFAEPLAQLRESAEEFASAGIAIRFVTIGSQAKAEEFCARHNPAARCIGDETMATYEAMGFTDFDLSKLKTDLALVARRNENEAAGFRQDWDATRIEDAARNPGAAAIDAAGIVRWMFAACIRAICHRSERCSRARSSPFVNLRTRSSRSLSYRANSKVRRRRRRLWGPMRRVTRLPRHRRRRDRPPSRDGTAARSDPRFDSRPPRIPRHSSLSARLSSREGSPRHGAISDFRAYHQTTILQNKAHDAMMSIMTSKTITKRAKLSAPSWPVAEAKARMSELIDRTLADGPQVITRKGHEVVVVVSVEEWKRKTKRKGNLAEFFAGSPLRGADVHFERTTDAAEPIEL